MLSSIDFQSWVIWKPVPCVATTKVGELEMWSKPFAPQGKARSWGFPSDYKLLCQEFTDECVSTFPTPFNVCIFSVK